MKKRSDSDLHGVAVIDKPLGLSSHGVVSRVRRALNTRRVGHAGTLDPLATGVLVVMVGEATKLSAYLTLDNKSYDAIVSLGTSTDTLDAEGAITAQAPLPAWLDDEADSRARIEKALETERQRTQQIPPAYSAIKVDGRAGYKRARAGEILELPPRAVHVHNLELKGRDAEHLQLSLKVSKGYYVRSLAHDLGVALDIPAHLSGLRRTASGSFTLEQATSIEQLNADALIPVTEVARQVMTVVELTESGVKRARFGQALCTDDFAHPPGEGVSAWLTDENQLVAVGVFEDGKGSVSRGFNA